MSHDKEAVTGFHDVGELDDALAAAVLRWVLSLADTKHRVGMRTSEWINGTPALEGAVGAAAITQDELGHARSYFSMLRDFPGAPDGLGFENDLEARELFYNPRSLNQPWDSWLDVIAVNVLLDRALSLAVEATAESTFAPLRQRAAKILQEERYHRIFGESWLARLSTRDDRTRRRLQASLDRFWATAMAWLGPDEDPVGARLHEAGILNRTTAELRQSCQDQASMLAGQHDLTIRHPEIDWSRWDPAFRDVAPG